MRGRGGDLFGIYWSEIVDSDPNYCFFINCFNWWRWTRGKKVWSEVSECCVSWKTSVWAPQTLCLITGEQKTWSAKQLGLEASDSFSRLSRGRVFEGGKCTCPLATCERLCRGASSPSLVFIKCVKAKRLLNGNALKQIDHTGSNCPPDQSQDRTDVVYHDRIWALISLYQDEYSWI